MKRYAKSCLVIAPALGIATFFLRLWLLTTGVDDRGLLVTSHMGNWLSMGLMLLGIVLFFLCSLGIKGPLPYQKMFPKSLLSAIGCFGGAVGVLVTDIGEFGAAANMIAIVSCVLGILAAGCLVVLGIFRLKGKQPHYGLHGLVTLYFMFHILSQYQRWNIEPQLQLYLPGLLASIFLMLGAYQRTALEAATGKRWAYNFFQQSATVLCFMAAAGEMPWFYTAMALWMGTADCVTDNDVPPAPMALPPEALACIEALEEKGHSAYVVGGCVRDHLLGLTPHDYDLCTDATPEELCEIFAEYDLVRSGEKHGTIGVVMNGAVYEITTFRAESTYSDNRHPDAVEFVRTIEEDLARRDFTINAMAWSPTRGYCDPFGGQEDLEKGILRAVGVPQERFEEDSLRILRGVRFAVRFRLQVEQETLDAMFACAPLMENLAWERVQTELLSLLPAVSAQDLLDFRPILLQILPELEPTVDFDQKNPHHLYDIYTHIAHTVENAPQEPLIRLAALLHDIGKPQVFTVDEEGVGHFYGHGQVSADIAREVLNRLKVSNLLKERVLFLIENHMDLHRPEKKSLRRRISKHGWEAELELLALQKADLIATGTDRTADLENYARIDALLEELRQEESCVTLKELAIKGADVIALGVEPGPKVGEILNTLLSQVLDETVPNEEEALLAAAKAIIGGSNA